MMQRIRHVPRAAGDSSDLEHRLRLVDDFQHFLTVDCFIFQRGLESGGDFFAVDKERVRNGGVFALFQQSVANQLQIVGGDVQRQIEWRLQYFATLRFELSQHIADLVRFRRSTLGTPETIQILNTYGN